MKRINAYFLTDIREKHTIVIDQNLSENHMKVAIVITRSTINAK